MPKVSKDGARGGGEFGPVTDRYLGPNAGIDGSDSSLWLHSVA